MVLKRYILLEMNWYANWQQISEIPPGPPFDKGGTEGLLERVEEVETQFALLQRFRSEMTFDPQLLHFPNADINPAILQQGQQFWSIRFPQMIGIKDLRLKSQGPIGDHLGGHGKGQIHRQESNINSF